MMLLNLKMQWTSVDCRDAIIAVYQKQVAPQEIPKRFLVQLKNME